MFIFLLQGDKFKGRRRNTNVEEVNSCSSHVNVISKGKGSQSSSVICDNERHNGSLISFTTSDTTKSSKRRRLTPVRSPLSDINNITILESSPVLHKGEPVHSGSCRINRISFDNCMSTTPCVFKDRPKTISFLRILLNW